MYGKKRLLKSMSTKNIDSRHSNSIFSSSGTPRIKYAEIKNFGMIEMPGFEIVPKDENKVADFPKDEKVSA